MAAEAVLGFFQVELLGAPHAELVLKFSLFCRLAADAMTDRWIDLFHALGTVRNLLSLVRDSFLVVRLFEFIDLIVDV